MPVGVAGKESSLTTAILDVLGDHALTYRKIATAVNQRGEYWPADGMYLAVAQVRDQIRRHADTFRRSRSGTVSLISAATDTKPPRY